MNVLTTNEVHAYDDQVLLFATHGHQQKTNSLKVASVEKRCNYGLQRRSQFRYYESDQSRRTKENSFDKAVQADQNTSLWYKELSLCFFKGVIASFSF